MNKHDVQLLDFPNEILFFILEKLDNIDVLYSLFGINNRQLNMIAQEQKFRNTLNLVSLSNSKLNRFCKDILPRINHNIKSLALDSVSMENIIRAGNYSNLTELTLFNFNKEIFSRYFMGKIFEFVLRLEKQCISFRSIILWICF
jgi:hypothetical protein